MLERDFQSNLIKEIQDMFPGCVVLKNDANYIQGFPDLTILFPNGKWALLECKQYKGSRQQPNQSYYIQWAFERSYGNFIYPRNKEEVLNELQCAFKSRRATRVSKRK
jgi:hypothetical protein